VIELDTNSWRLKQTAMFRHGHESIYLQLVDELKHWSVELIAIFKELQSNSDTTTFPLLNSVQMLEWFN
jgi:hypothetical protein